MNTTRRINTKTNIFLKTKINRQKKKNKNISNNNKNNKILRRQESQKFLIVNKK